MLHAFLFEVSGLAGNYTLQNRELECIKYLQGTVSRNKVLVSKFLAKKIIWDVIPLVAGWKINVRLSGKIIKKIWDKFLNCNGK